MRSACLFPSYFRLSAVALASAFFLLPAPAFAGRGRGAAALVRGIMRLIWVSNRVGSSSKPEKPPLKWPPQTGDIYELFAPLSLDQERKFELAPGNWVKVLHVEAGSVAVEGRSADRKDLGKGWATPEQWAAAGGTPSPSAGAAFQLSRPLSLSDRANPIALSAGCWAKVEADAPPADRAGQLRLKAFGPDKKEAGLGWVQADALRQAAEDPAAATASQGSGLTTLGKIIVGLIVLAMIVGIIQGIREAR
jgi:hypothetical protein